MTVQTKRREIGNLILENIPDIPVQLNKRLHQYHNTREAHLADWLPDGNGLLILTRFGESAQIHRVDEPLGQRQQLTFFKEPVFAASSRPGGRNSGFLFAKDIGGNESYQLFYQRHGSDRSFLLTDGQSRHGQGLWNNAGTAFAYNSSSRNFIDQDIYLYHIGQGPDQVFEGIGYWFPVAWSPCDRYLTVINYRSINESHLHLLDCETGKLRAVVAQSEVACMGGVWSGDGSHIFFSCDAGRNCRELAAYELRSGNWSFLTKPLNMEAEDIQLSADGRQLAFLLNRDGISQLYLYDLEAGSYRRAEGLPEGVISKMCWHPTECRLALTLNRPQAPADVFVLHTCHGSLTQWTQSEVGGLNPEHFVQPSLIRYRTFDDTEAGEPRYIPAYYYRPKQQEQPSPVLIFIHGGPESQYRPNFSPAFQYYINELKLAVIAPNVRGSTGYGKHYLKLDNGYKREDAVQDIGQLLDWIDKQPELDSSRVAVMGGSYGGYMVLASMSHFNDRLCCGIDIFGISNFVTFLQNTKSYRRDLRRVEYGDERDPDMRQHLQRISPTTNAHKITKPMMIVQGLNDPRVPASEAEQMVRAIRDNGGEAWYLLAKDEGHGFRKKTNRDFYNKAVILFLQTHLLQPEEVVEEFAL